MSSLQVKKDDENAQLIVTLFKLTLTAMMKKNQRHEIFLTVVPPVERLRAMQRRLSRVCCCRWRVERA